MHLLKIYNNLKVPSINKFKTFLYKIKRVSIGKVIIYNKIKIHTEKKSRIICAENSFFALNIGWTNKTRSNGELILRENAKIYVHGIFKIYSSCKVVVKNNALLTLGSGYINSNVNINCTEKIEIGYEVAIAENVVIRDSDTHPILTDNNKMTQPVKIGNKVWIGMNVMILKGVEIGDGTIIAAGSIVTKSIPSRSLVAGVPGRVIKQNIEWGNETLEEFNKKHKNEKR